MSYISLAHYKLYEHNRRDLEIIRNSLTPDFESFSTFEDYFKYCYPSVREFLKEGESPFDVFNCSDECYRPDLNFIHILLKAGANINIQDKYGKTPLHVACTYRSYQIVDECLRYGADINILDSTSETALSLSTKILQNTNKLSKVVASAAVIRSLQKHIAMLMAANLHIQISKRIYSDIDEMKLIINDNNFLSDTDIFFKECKKEVKLLKKLQICETTSLFDILHENEHGMTSHVQLPFFFETSFLHIKEMHPIYGPLIILQIKRGLKRRSFCQIAEESLESLTNVKFCPSFINNVFKYLSIEDLINVTKASNDRFNVVKFLNRLKI